MTERQRNGFVLLLVLGLIARLGGRDRDQEDGSSASTSRAASSSSTRASRRRRRRTSPRRAPARRRHHARARRPARRRRAGDPDHGRATRSPSSLPNVKDAARAEKQVGTTARLEFYDWEANVAHAERQDGGQSAAAPRIRTSATISQGGTDGARVAGRRAAVALRRGQARLQAAGPVEPGQRPRGHRSTTCSARPGARRATAAGQGVRVPRRCRACTACSPGRTTTAPTCISGLPAGVTPPRARCSSCRRGRSCCRPPTPASRTRRSSTDPTAQFYVLKDHVSLFGNDITNPQQSTDSVGRPGRARSASPRKGETRRSRTSRGQIAQRGELDSVGSSQLNQHFAVALDNKLITVPQIDFKPVPGRDRRRAAAPTSPAASRSSRLRTSPPSCASARCRST